MWAALVVFWALLLGGAKGSILDTGGEDALQHLVESIAHPKALQWHVEAVGATIGDGKTDCLVGLGRWATGLASLQPWAVRMIDSSSKFVTGVLAGNTIDMGNFDECVASGDVGLLGWSGRFTLPRVEFLASRDNATESGQQGMGLSMAVCVPSVCQPALLQAAFDRAVHIINSKLGRTVLRCTLDESATLTAGLAREPVPSDYVMIFVCVGLALIVLVATMVDQCLGSDGKVSRRKAYLLLAFSAKENARRLMKPPSAGDFTCVNGIRFLSAMWVVLGHRYIAVIQMPFMNLLRASQRARDVSAMIIINAPLSVDSFFLIGGLVNCYGFLRMTQNKRSFNFIMYNVHRYIRLTPAFALMVGITATWLSLLSTGPIWHQLVEAERGYCQRYWWTALLYVANYVNPDTQCMGQSWYLMVDMQLHWLSPLLLYPLWRWGCWGALWCCTVLVAACAVPFTLTYVYQLPTPFPSQASVAVMRSFMRNMYYATHPRFTAYVFGTLTGYVLFLIKTDQFKLSMTPIRVVVGWLLSAALCLTVLFTGHILMDHTHHPYNVVEAAFYSGFYRLGWSLGLAWVVMACILGYGGPINAFLSWRPFSVLGRLTYGIYLTHAAVQLVDHGTMRSPLTFSDFKNVENMLSDVLISIFLGACLSMAVESPISALEKHFRTSKTDRNSDSVSKENLSARQALAPIQEPL